MSLDVNLISLNPEICVCQRCGNSHKCTYTILYSDNITHNLGKMAAKAGIYYALWRPEEINLKLAKELIPYLQKGLKRLKSVPEKYKKYNPDNGWGSYEVLVNFCENYLDVCIAYPELEIEVSR